MTRPIEDYAIIGDGATAALVARDGSVDWLCLPRFDGAACFAALLGDERHGRWRIAPTEEPRAVRRRYLEDSLVLETRFETDGGVVSCTDFMTGGENGSRLVRLVRGEAGRVAMQVDLVIRFDYGAVIPWVTRTPGSTTELHAVAGPDRLTLRTPVALQGEDHRTAGRFEIQAGETVSFVLSHGPSHRPPPPPLDVDAALSRTLQEWRDWAGCCGYRGPWRDAVVRSLITLKSLIYAPTGAIVAAPTTSLPEHLGGERNWDYRFCWLRDATFTLLALMNAGYYQEACAWREWLVRALAGDPAQAQILYGVAGERRLTEWEVPWLPGYGDSRPVRIGNAAYGQMQLDIYGEVADALHAAREGHLAASDAGWAVQRALTRHVEGIWQHPDEGMWEVRGPRQHFVHSKVMAWVAMDRAVKSIEHFGLRGPLARWQSVRDAIHADVCARGFDAARGSFVQAYGSTQLDASLLLIPLVGFLPAHDPRVLGTMERIGRELMDDGLVMRYRTERTDDGLPPGEGAFLACSFWYVDNLALAGRHDEACAMFERLLALRNDVGLLAEEYDPRGRRHLGNFPQAFSHIALVDSAYNLNVDDDAKPARQRGRHQDAIEGANAGRGADAGQGADASRGANAGQGGHAARGGPGLAR